MFILIYSVDVCDIKDFIMSPRDKSLLCIKLASHKGGTSSGGRRQNLTSISLLLLFYLTASCQNKHKSDWVSWFSVETGDKSCDKKHNRWSGNCKLHVKCLKGG